MGKRQIRWPGMLLGGAVVTLSIGLVVTAVMGDYQMVIGDSAMPGWLSYVMAAAGVFSGTTLMRQSVVRVDG